MEDLLNRISCLADQLFTQIGKFPSTMEWEPHRNHIHSSFINDKSKDIATVIGVIADDDNNNTNTQLYAALIGEEIFRHRKEYPCIGISQLFIAKILKGQGQDRLSEFYSHSAAKIGLETGRLNLLRHALVLYFSPSDLSPAI
jgi:hypothetical protein